MHEKYDHRLQSILYSSEYYALEEVRHKLDIDHVVLKKWEKEILTDLITAIKKGKKGKKINEKNYTTVLDAFALTLFWENNLRTRNLKKNKDALRKLESLGRKIPSSSLAYRVEERNRDLRKHVKSGFIHYASYDNFKFLEDDFDDDFNPLDEMRIHAALRERAKQKQLPLLMRWVNTAENETYKCFLIDEIGFFKQTESCQHLLDLYRETRSNPVKAKIVQTLGTLKYTQALTEFSESYGSVPESVQICIIDAMGQFETPETLLFLEKIYHQSANTDTFIRIVHNIYTIDSTKETFLRLKRSALSPFQLSVFDHAEQSARPQATTLPNNVVPSAVSLDPNQKSPSI